MARTIPEIYSALIAEKQSQAALNSLLANPDDAQTFLDDLTSSSKVAVWRNLLWLYAVGIWSLEILFDLFKVEIEDLKHKLVVATVIWYRERCFDFQYGDSLEWNGAQFAYATITEANQIIKRAAVIDAGGIVRIKVAKLDGSDLPIPLLLAEKTAFETYIKSIAVAGVKILVTSQEADLLKLAYTVFYDPLVLTETGESITEPGVFPVQVAIDAHVQELPFNGILNLTSLTDSVQSVTGVIDPILDVAEAHSGNNPYAPITNNYTATAGHMKIDPLFPLDTQITYTSI